jgi:tetratricopeptide (TPR) repeat protein
MLTSSLAGAVFVTASLLVLGPDQPGGVSPERGYQQALERLRRGAFDQSLRDAQLAEARWRRWPDSEWNCKFRLLEAEILLEKAEHGRARELLETAAACRRHTRVEIRRRVLLAKLRTRLQTPDPKGALLLLEEARRMAESAGSAGDAAAANNLGMIQQRRARCDAAIAHFDQALQVWHELGADQLSAATANNLGLCYSELGNFDKAMEHRREAMRLPARRGARRDRPSVSGEKPAPGRDPVFSARAGGSPQVQ